ncbi:rhomboid-related protein 2-like [Cylas formicarius]|uniref:rhomboid-related protein 2-like n=1 Tax=Cylas formicarius TaxID=197179 RepID=UPI00295834FE|nr:rhomboid-related protein 2-like [Cylas formicarius]
MPWAADKPRGEKRKLYRKIFEECDADGNSLICLDELDNFLRSSGRGLPRDVVRYVHDLADKGGNRTLDFDEFVDLLEHPDWQHVFERWVNSYVHFLVPCPKGAAALVPAAPTTDYARVYQRDSLDYADEYTCRPPPVAMLLITLLEVALFLTDELTQKGSTMRGTGVTADLLVYDPAKRSQCWRYLTYMFVHVGYVHITVNMLVQLTLGVPLEMVHRWWRVLLVYLLGVVAGSLTTSVADPRVRLAGASGGVYALMTAHIASIIMNWREMQFAAVRLFIFGIVVSCDVGSAIYDRYFLNVDHQVGYAAHFGGAVAGLLVGIYALRNLNVTKAERYVWWLALVLYVALTLVAILVNVTFPSRYPAAP